MMKNDTCSVCRFWHALEWAGPGEGSPSAGSCRRRPPVITGQPANDTEVQYHTYFPETQPDVWCGEFLATPEHLAAERRAHRVDRAADVLVTAARTAAAGEAKERDPTDWRVDWRAQLRRVSRRVSREVQHLDGEVRDRAKALAADDEALLDLLNWAALDTAFAEVGKQ